MNKKKLVVFTCCGMGDFIWATSAISLIKNYDKNINLTLITFDSYKLLIDHKLQIDNVICTNSKKFFSKNKIIKWIYKSYWLIKLFFYLNNFDMLICLDNHTLFIKFAKYIYRIKDIVGPDMMHFGYDEINKNIKYYTRKVLLPKDSDRNHCMMRYQDIIRSIFPNYNLALPILPTTDSMLNKIKNNFLQNTKKYKIAFCTQGSGIWKCFPIDFSIQLLQNINKLKDVTFFIVGGTNSQYKEAVFLQESLKDIDIRNICKKTSLLELKEFLGNMDLLISVDTGVSHLAAVANVPIISFYSATLPEQTGVVSSKFVPLYNKIKCCPCNREIEINKKICDNPKCMTTVKIEKVLQEIKKILK